MSDDRTMSLDQVAARLDAILELSDDVLTASAVECADELLALGEAVLETWLIAHDTVPTDKTAEGFRLLALHRQAARGNPSFNACRETCRELVYHHNFMRLDPARANAAHVLRLGAMVARHLVLFIGGKLEVAGLGEFCCSSRPLRQREAPAATAISGA